MTEVDSARRKVGKQHSRPLRIAFVVNEFPAVTEPYVSEEIAALRDRGHQVLVVSAYRPGRAAPVEREVNAGPDPDRVEICYLSPIKAVPFLGSCLWTLRYFALLRPTLSRVLFSGPEGLLVRIKGLKHILLGVYCARMLASHGVEHLHAHHGYFAAFAAAIAARILGIRYTLTIHGSDLLVNQHFLDVKVAGAKATFTVSEYNRHLLRSHFLSNAGRRVVLRRLGVDLASVASRSQRSLLLSVGRLTPVKNQQLLIRALGRLKRGGSPVTALIVGGGEDESALRVLAREHDVGEQVVFLGWLPRQHVMALYGAADLFVLTSLSEGLPLVLMEAMASGTIVVAPRITGIPELIEDGRSGFLFPADDCETLAATIKRVLDSSPESLAAVRAEAAQRIAHDFNARSNTDRFIDQLTLIAKSNRNENSVL